MARLGLYPALIIVVFGVVVPFFIFKLGRLIGFAPLLGLAFVLGLGYGAVKAGISLVETELLRKCRLHGSERVHPRFYAAVSYSAGALIDRTMSSLRRD